MDFHLKKLRPATATRRDDPDQLSSKATRLALIKDSEDHDTLSKLSRCEAGKPDPGDSNFRPTSKKK